MAPDETTHPEQVPAFVNGVRLQWEPTQNCTVLLYPEGMVKLSPTASEILRKVDGAKSVKTIIDELANDYDDHTLGSDVTGFLKAASEHGWIDLRP